jgi:transketolase
MTGEFSPLRTPLDARALEFRKRIVKMLGSAKRGHVGSAFSVLEILRVLYDDVLNFKAEEPRWPSRDRCILSKGHGCLALYVVLADHGFFPEEHLWRSCRSDAILGGHPEYGKVPGVEASTGSLGHGLAIGVGFALNARYEKAAYRTFVVVGDGESNEGAIWESALCASKHRLSNLTVLVDYNEQQSYGSTHEVLELEPFADKWRAFGFAVAEVDGHDVGQLREVLQRVPLDDGKPTAIICHTIKGKGVSFVENNMAWHHKNNPSEAEIADMVAELDAENA